MLTYNAQNAMYNFFVKTMAGLLVVMYGGIRDILLSMTHISTASSAGLLMDTVFVLVLVMIIDKAVTSS